MPTLAQTWIYGGRTYGPGEVEVGDAPGQMPKDAAEALEKRGAFGDDVPLAPLRTGVVDTVQHKVDGVKDGTAAVPMHAASAPSQAPVAAPVVADEKAGDEARADAAKGKK